MHDQFYLHLKFRDDILALKLENPKLAAKVWVLIVNIIDTPYDGLGKPEALKGNMTGCWSRRIDQKHRLVYQINEKDDRIELLSCYGHYEDR